MKLVALLLFLLSLLSGCLQLHVVLGQDQSGFISLDCGLVPNDSNYTEKTTGLIYASDAGFIDHGEKKAIKENFRKAFQQQLWFLRSFPQGLRNCYEFNLSKGGFYLIKAFFLYGNYDDLNTLPEMDLYLGTNLWTSVTVRNLTTVMLAEVIHRVTTDKLHVCIVRKGETTPFISALEIRPMRDNTYRPQSGSLLKISRWSVSSATNNFIRFPEDIHDRGWELYFQNDWTRLNSTNSINTETEYDLPQSLVKTAATPRDSRRPLTISLPVLRDSQQIYVYMHFVELVSLQANESREFEIFYNGKIWYKAFRPRYLNVVTIYSRKALYVEGGKSEFILRKTKNSTHPPIINALEAFVAIDMLNPETNDTDVKAITDVKSFYGVREISWQGDPCVPQDYAWKGLNCSYNDSNFPRIISLNLSARQLVGNIAPHFSKLSSLEYLDLSNNSLTGTVPEFLSGLPSLTVLILSGNQLNGSVPSTLIDKANKGLLTLRYDGNPELCGLASCAMEVSKKKHAIVLPITLSIAFVFAFLAAVLIFVIYRKKKHRAAKSLRKAPTWPSTDRRFAYADVIKMTNNFERVLGKGASGEVYYGFVNDQQVAVKVLFGSSAQGYKEFKAEVELLLRVHHRHLVKLVGYCEEEDKMVLVYEYMANGDIKSHLSGKPGTTFLDWKTRLRIAAEAAQGLYYLHRGCTPGIIHRDLKTSNILLDEQFRTKIADFGLSRSFSNPGDSHISTVLAGTPGFLDPEYFRSNRLTEKSDVYSFGVVLLELLTNRPVIYQSDDESHHLIDWVISKLNEGDITSIIDPDLKGKFDANSAWIVIEVAMSCLNQSSTMRPSMAQVVTELTDRVTSLDPTDKDFVDRNNPSYGRISSGCAILPSAR